MPTSDIAPNYNVPALVEKYREFLQGPIAGYTRSILKLLYICSREGFQEESSDLSVLKSESSEEEEIPALWHILAYWFHPNC